MLSDLKDLIPELNTIRRHLHEYPEIAYKEFQTTQYIEETIKRWGLKFHPFKRLQTGGYCDVGAGPLMAFRADIDGLAVMENQEHPCRSQISGMMHACGHDYHITLGLGLLRYFVRNNILKNRLRVIFQPAEEAYPGGAKDVIAENILRGCKVILTTHVLSDLTVGKIGLCQGVSSASSSTLAIEISGPGGHTSRPHESVDLIRLTGAYLCQMNDYVQQKTDPRLRFTLVFGEIKGGTAHNIIPQFISLRGTLRTLEVNLAPQIIDEIRQFSAQYSQIYGCTIVVSNPSTCPVVVNDQNLVKYFVDFAKAHKIEHEFVLLPQPSMGADDFAYYLDKIPGLYMKLGCGGKGSAHSGEFEADESMLAPAMNHLISFIKYLSCNRLIV